jgi:hypothetical protein
MSTNTLSTVEISALKKFQMEPQGWKMEQQDNGEFLLSVTYMQVSVDSWLQIETRRGDVKRYKTADACLKDVSRVQKSAQIIASLS